KGQEVLELLSKNVKVSIHSDDPAYFGGYISDNYTAIASQFKLTKPQISQLARNSFESSWISDQQKEIYLNELNNYVNSN
ncbi:adenosine deaminase, partial [Clostridioides difficile]|uniref:hypothetical protein n=1 Tax=Clostridioides difficile TaxID=1496 RepID=UPI002A339924|nr:adenosine deaminase [Clostridioides difficile]